MSRDDPLRGIINFCHDEVFSDRKIKEGDDL